MFSHFLPYSNPSALLIHANEESKLWHERFGHLNYNIFYLSEKYMVIGLPKIKFSKGVCQGCILGKHPEHKFERASHERTSAPRSTMMLLVHSLICLWVRPNMHWISLMTFPGIAGFTSWNTSLDFLASSKSLRLWLKTSLGGNSRSSDLIMVLSMSSLSSSSIAKMQALHMQHSIP